jgi:hypothetical protein
MMYGKYILIFLVLFFISFQSMAQVLNLQLSNSAFHKKRVSNTTLFSPNKPSFTTAFPSSQNHTSFGSFVHYPAFFCQMELKSANRLGVMVKIHAGNYDSYHDRR